MAAMRARTTSQCAFGVLSLVSPMAAPQLWGHHHLQDGKEEVVCTVLGTAQGWAVTGGFSAMLVFAPDMILGYSV